MKTIGRLFSIVILGYLMMTLLVYLLQRDLMFAPSTQRVSPAAMGLAHVREVTLLTPRSEKLYCWYAEATPGAPTLLMFHGNGGNVSFRHHKIKQLTARGYGVFLLGYPGYGGSEGAPSEAAFIESATLAYQHLTEDIPAEQLVVYGTSLGSAVAVQLAAKVATAAVVLEAPMNSILEIAQGQYPFLPVRWLIKDPFLSSDHIAQLGAPLLVIHGSNDRLIPLASGQALFNAAQEPKSFHIVAGGGHNNLYDYPVVDIIQGFLADHQIGTVTQSSE